MFYVFTIIFVAMMMLRFYQMEKKLKEWTIQENNKMHQEIENMTDTLSSYDQKIIHLINGGVALLQDRLLQSCRVFIERGKISATAKENIKNMYKWYTMYKQDEVVSHFVEAALRLDVDKINKDTLPLSKKMSI